MLAIGVALAALTGSLSGRSVRRLTDRLILAALVAVAVAIASGLLLLVTGHSPTDPLHLLYAVVALAALPVARFAVPSVRSERRGWIVAGGGLILIGLMVRLLQTG